MPVKFRHLQWSVFLLFALGTPLYNGISFMSLVGGIIGGVMFVVVFSIFGWPIYRIFANMLGNGD